MWVFRCYARDRQTSHEKLSAQQLASDAAAAAADAVSKVTVATDAQDDQHVACWRLDRRGAVGETALHLCMLYSSLPEFRAISVALLDIFPTLSVDYYEGDEYYGKLMPSSHRRRDKIVEFRRVEWCKLNRRQST